MLVFPAAATRVGSQSCWEMISFETWPGSILPGHRTAIGTRKPPSHVVFFFPRRGRAER